MANFCCDPCPWCDTEIAFEEIQVGDDDYSWYHWCPAEDCEWDDSEGRNDE